MRIAYCTNVRLPSERAHGHQVAQVCDALAHLGHEVTIFAPFRRNVVRDDYWDYYHADRSVQVRYLGSFDPIQSKLLPGVAGLLTLNAMLRKSLQAEVSADAFDVVYTRSPALLPALLKSDVPVILELHQLPRRQKRLFAKQCMQCALVSCLTSPMRDALVSWGVAPQKVIVAGDAVDLSRFGHLPSREAARAQFNIHTNRIVVGYVGRLKTLGMEKGVGILLQALKDLSDSHAYFGFIVGGPAVDQHHYEAVAKKLGLGPADVMFTGEIPSDQVATALAACDVLAMPFPDLPHYRLYMSPLKMFEYMAANRPIVTSDLPTIRDVLNHDNAIFCDPGDDRSLALALRWIKDHEQEAAERAQRAAELVKTHTWEERMKRILEAATLTA